MLHILNGDSSANILKQSTISGERLPWREALMAGPRPAGLSHDQWLEVRAQHLAEAYERAAQDCRKDLSGQYERLQTFAGHEEVVLWFEHDLFCQINLLYLLNWFSQKDLSKTKLNLICIGAFPGKENFRGLGELTPAQMESLFDQRHEVSSAEKKLAAEAWAAYCSPTPQALAHFLEKDTSALPFVHAALSKHLERFPSVRNGLGCIENKALELIAAGANEFMSLFPAFGAAEPIYGLGDFQFWNDLKRLAKARQPLLTAEADDGLDHALANGNYLKTSFKITEKGKAVLAGQDDFVKSNGIDLWLGGVHLSNEKTVWRWDEQNRRIVRGEELPVMNVKQA